MKRYLIQLLLAVSLLTPVALFNSGCATDRLEPGGAYAPLDVSGNAIIEPDYQFFVVDAAYLLAYKTVDSAFEFERNNRTLLWQVSPQLKKALDKIRPQAVQIRDEYARARAAYLANPVPANLTQLQALLAKLQQLAQTAIAVMPSKTSNPGQ